MMKNIISSPYRKMKVLLILPVFALVMYSFAKPDYKYTVAGQKQAGVVYADTTKKTNKWVTPPPPPPPPVPADLNTKDAPTPPPSINENQPLPAPPPPPTLKFQTDGSNPIFIIDGEIVSKADVEKIDPQAIESINVNRDNSVTEKYGKKGKDGVIEITLKNNDKEFENAAFPEQAKPVKEGAIEVKTNKVQKVEIRSQNGVKPLIVVDGVIKDIEIDAIDPEAIESMSVLKDKDAIDKYGQKGKDGVIELILKKDVQVENTVEPVIVPVKK